MQSLEPPLREERGYCMLWCLCPGPYARTSGPQRLDFRVRGNDELLLGFGSLCPGRFPRRGLDQGRFAAVIFRLVIEGRSTE
jgi:hypothetical protein